MSGVFVARFVGERLGLTVVC